MTVNINKMHVITLTVKPSKSPKLLLSSRWPFPDENKNKAKIKPKKSVARKNTQVYLSSLCGTWIYFGGGKKVCDDYGGWERLYGGVVCSWLCDWMRKLDGAIVRWWSPLQTCVLNMSALMHCTRQWAIPTLIASCNGNDTCIAIANCKFQTKIMDALVLEEAWIDVDRSPLFLSQF